jgi:hypothetical protein
MVALNGKRFAGLIICRVDTSVGSEQFTRLASLLGGSLFTYALSPAQTFIFDRGLGSITATFNATAATLTSGAGTYPTTFVGGETATIDRDDADPVVVTFRRRIRRRRRSSRASTPRSATRRPRTPAVATLVSLNRGTGATITSRRRALSS